MNQERKSEDKMRKGGRIEIFFNTCRDGLGIVSLHFSIFFKFTIVIDGGLLVLLVL